MSNTEDYLKGVTFVDIFGERSDNPNTDRKLVTSNTEDYLAGITLDIIRDESDYIETDKEAGGCICTWYTQVYLSLNR